MNNIDAILNELFCPRFDSVNGKSYTNATGFPPYSIIKLEDGNHRIDISVAGYGKDNLEVVVDKRQLIVKGKSAVDKKERIIEGNIKRSSFTRSFALAEYVEVGNTTYVDGILSIKLTKVVPEEMKPRKVTIS